MQYTLLIYDDEAAGATDRGRAQRALRRVRKFTEDVRDAGILVGGNELQPPGPRRPSASATARR